LVINIQLRHILVLGITLGVFLLSREIRAEEMIGGPRENIASVTPILDEEKSEKILLSHREEILRTHREKLQEEMNAVLRERKAVQQALVRVHRGNASQQASDLESRLRELSLRERDIRDARRVILSLVREGRKADALLLASYRSQREQPHVARKERKQEVVPDSSFVFTWPVMPRKGISAGYLDEAYEKRFGLAHQAIDIPVAQGTEIHAPARGVVLEVHDRGYGYSTIVLSHENDYTTVFGHVSNILVSAGDTVHAGQVIALSGGRPGSRGAGLLTTGPHVHFEVLAYGQPIDPLYVLPPMATLAASIAN
jgi:murein DD-endopeptidase MepM/ murein hydrolase activator NlpD